jgi:hypothetical protein
MLIWIDVLSEQCTVNIEIVLPVGKGHCRSTIQACMPNPLVVIKGHIDRRRRRVVRATVFQINSLILQSYLSTT